MSTGANVIEDYSNVGLTLRAHPMSFLRKGLQKRRILTCAEAISAPDGRWIMTSGLILVRQKPGSAKGVMFMTIEDETGIVNAVIWPSLFEKQRRVVLGSVMIGINGKIQREGDVVHLVAQRLFDFSTELSALGERNRDVSMPHGRGDEFAHATTGSPDSRARSKPSTIINPDIPIDTLRVKSRNFQ